MLIRVKRPSSATVKMVSHIVTTTLQAATLGGISNCLAQTLEAYRHDQPLGHISYTPLLQFIIYQLLATPPNVLWQGFLEDRFPAYFVDLNGDKRLRKGNTAVKFSLDQTLGAVVNSLLFIAGIGTLKGKDRVTVLRDCQTVRALER